VDLVVKPDKSRYVYLYLPSTEDKQRWDSLAKNAKVPLSKFVIEIVENALADESDFTPRGELVKQLGTFREEIRKLQEELKLKNIVIDKYESELKRYRGAVFLESEFKGSRTHSKELVDILKRGKVVDSYRILEDLGIDPRETDLVKAVSVQLENLESYGLVSSTQRGWRWVG
jgi:predicted DNA-binding protein